MPKWHAPWPPSLPLVASIEFFAPPELADLAGVGMAATRYRLFAGVAPGLETLLSDELSRES